jgi:hypothetical protein
MFSRNYNLNPVRHFRSRSWRRMCFTLAKKMKTTFLLTILTSLHVLADDPSLKPLPDPTGKSK